MVVTVFVAELVARSLDEKLSSNLIVGGGLTRESRSSRRNKPTNLAYPSHSLYLLSLSDTYRHPLTGQIGMSSAWSNG